MKKGHTLRLVTGAAALVLVATACSSGSSGGSSGNKGSASKAPYKFAFTGPLSGPVGVFIGPAQQGISDYFKYINSKGGVNGHTLQLSSTDIVLDTPKAVAAYRQYAGDSKVLAITGLGISSQIAPIAPSLARDGVTGISITSGDPTLLPYSKWYFSFGDDLAGEGSAALQYILKDNPHAKIAYFSYDTPAEEALAASVVKEVKASGGATLVNKTLVPFTSTDVSVEIGKLLKSKPDWIFNGGSTTPIATSAVNSLKTDGFSGKMIVAAAGGDDSDFATGGNDKFVYAATKSFRSPSETDIPAVADMMTHVTGTQPVRQYYTSGWVLGEVIAAAVKTCGDSCNRANFRDALEQVNITDTQQLAGGPVGFSSTCHQGFRTALIYTWDAASKKSKYVTSLPWYTSGPCAGS